VSVRIRFTPTLSASTSVVAEENESQLIGSSSRRSLSSSLRWTPIPEVAPSVAFSESRDKEPGAAEQISRSYSVTVATYPLSTLGVTLGATRTDQYSDSDRVSNIDRYILVTTAQLYPDLVAGWDTSYQIGQREPAGDTGGATESIEAFNSRLALNAKLTPKLTGDLTTNYSRRREAAATADSQLTLGYRASDLLFLRLAADWSWIGEGVSDSLDLGGTVALLRTDKTQLSLQYTLHQEEETSHHIFLYGSWNISQQLALQGRGNYTIGTAARWNVDVSLSLAL
jgi:hypothetical protein